MWMSYSPDLRHWGSHRVDARSPARWLVGRQQDRPFAAAHRERPQGWLVIYHGVRQTASGSLYRLGLASV